MNMLKIKKSIEYIKNNIYSIEDNIYKFKSKYNDISKENETDYKIIEEEIELIKKELEEIRDPFLLFVIGVGNYGKSTITNALLKKEIIRTTSLPNTWQINMFLKGNKDEIEILYNNTKLYKKYDEGLMFIKEEERKIKESRIDINKRLKEYKNDIYGKSIYDYRKELEIQHLYTPPIQYIKYHLNDIDLLNNFIIVDTPGLNQSLNYNKRIDEYYMKCDGILWIIDAQNIVAKENNNLIQEIDEIQNIGNICKHNILVVNKIDIIKNQTDAKENIEKIKKEISNKYAHLFEDIVFISAKQAIQGYKSNDEELVKNSNIKQLEESIQNNIFLDLEEAKVKTKYKNIVIRVNRILTKTKQIKRNIYKDMCHSIEINNIKNNRIKIYKKNISNALDEFEKTNKITKLKFIEAETIALQENININLKEVRKILGNEIKNIDNEIEIIQNDKVFVLYKLQQEYTPNKKRNKIIKNSSINKISYKSKSIKSTAIKTNYINKINNFQRYSESVKNNKYKLKKIEKSHKNNHIESKIESNIRDFVKEIEKDIDKYIETIMKENETNEFEEVSEYIKYLDYNQKILENME